MGSLSLLLSRKFLLTVLVTVLGVFFVKAEPSVQLEFLKWIAGIYVTGNVTQKAIVKE
jgi:hypothetical protein